VSAARPVDVAAFASAHLLSAFGYEFLTFVMTVRVYELTGRAVDVGIFTALAFVPRLLSSFYGMLTDRYPRRLLFVATCVATAMTVVVLGRQTGVATLYACWFVVSILAMIVMNVRTAIMTGLMPSGQYSRGNALMLVSLNAARLLAPIAGGVAAVRWSAADVLSIAAGAYALAAIAGIATRMPSHAPDSTASTGIFARWQQGLSLIWQNVDLRLLGGIVVIWRLCLGFQGAMLLVYVVRGLGCGAVEFGVMTAALAVGSIMGSLVGPALTRLVAARVILTLGIGLHFILIGTLGLIDDFAVAIIDGAAANLVLYAATVAVHSVRDTVTPAGYRGRVYGVITTITAPPALVSMLIGGWLADVIGVRALFIGGGSMALAMMMLAFALSPSARASMRQTPAVGRAE
jgi:MFS transporter, DHA3 family, macrolide efflux protein